MFSLCFEYSETWECPDGFERCSGSRQCIRDYLFCDDIDNCGIGSDEDVAFCGELANLAYIFVMKNRT